MSDPAADPAREPERARGAAAPAISVVIPTLNGGAELEGVLQALARQRRERLAGPVELVVIDSGSTDGTLAAAARHGARILKVEKDAFDHGDTRNLAIHHTRAPLVILLSQDAEPVGERWLETIVRPVREDERVAAAYGRLRPRPGLDPLLRRRVEGDLNHAPERREAALEDAAAFAALSPYERRLAVNFHDVGSCLRRGVWERLPLPRTPFGEDLMWAKAVLESGHRIVYEPRAELWHSHRYGVRSLYRRTWWDGWLNRRLCDRLPVARAHHGLIQAARGIAADLAYLRRHGASLAACARALPRSLALETAAALGFYRGARRTPHLPVFRSPVPDRPLRILFVVHGFPPADLAGTEVHTLTVGRALAAHGHRVAVFHRVAAPAAAEYSLEHTSHEGLTVYRLVNNFRYAGVEETYRNPHVEDRFREVLAAEQPDVVHFQHCLHTSVSLIALSEDRGIPTVVTLADYWFICPTVQLIRPDRSLCHVQRAGLACVRCARPGRAAVRAGQAAVRLLRPLAHLGPLVYERLAARFPRLRRDVLDDARALMRRPGSNRAYLRRAGRVLAPSHFLRRQYLRFGLDAEQIVYQRYGIDTARLAGLRKTARSGALRVGFIGSFVWYKGLHVLIEAFRTIPPERARLTVHGNPDAPPEVRAYAAACRQAAVGAPVHFAGPLARDRLAAAHGELDVLVVPSLWYENSPLVILEAQAARTPVIASDLGGMAELVQDGRTGLLFPAGDAVALRRAILALADDPARVAALAERIDPPKDVATHVAELMIVYRQEISRPRAATGRVPFWAVAGGRFVRAAGRVEVQGDQLALLRPRPEGPSSVSYPIRIDRPGPVRFEVTTRLLAGEEGVILSGGLFVEDALVGEIPPHRTGDGPALVRRHRFQYDCRAGLLTLTLVNGPAGATGASNYLRVQRVEAFREPPDRRESIACPSCRR
ncbi:MAG: glycosyltransferase [Planctomycetes bacterium]|nr:glycosyltransferase [Planctomycetota bacterium]